MPNSPVMAFTLFISVLCSSLQTYANGLRFVLTILGGTIAVMGSRVIGYTSAGALGCVTTAFIARIGWRREERKLTPQQLQAQQVVSIQALPEKNTIKCSFQNYFSKKYISSNEKIKLNIS